MDGFLIEVATGLVVAHVSDCARVDAGHLLVSDVVYAEAVAGAPLPWPRRFRDAALTATDYTDGTAWRARTAPETVAAWDAWREALRNLPATCPDPAAIGWPPRPDGKAYVPAITVGIDQGPTPDERATATRTAAAVLANWMADRRRDIEIMREAETVTMPNPGAMPAAG